MITYGKGTAIATGNEEGNIVFDGCDGQEGTCDDLDNLPEFLSSDMDLAEFAADVENLLGLDEDSPDIRDLDLLDCKEEKEEEDSNQKFHFVDHQDKEVVKIKDEEDFKAIKM